MGEAKREGDQSSPAGITPLLVPLQALQDLLAHFSDRGVIIGGVAASLLGTPRFTVDLDAVILLNLDEVSSLLEKAAALNIEPRISNPFEFAKRNRVLLLRHSPSGTDIDISLGFLPFEIEMIERSENTDIGSIQLRLPTPEDLIIMKAVAHRPKDIEDIRAIAESNPGLDKQRIRFWVAQFGEALDLPDLVKEILRLL